jgi:hypothetical protein
MQTMTRKGPAPKKADYKIFVVNVDESPEIVDALNEYHEQFGVPKVTIARQALRLWLDTNYPECEDGPVE